MRKGENRRICAPPMDRLIRAPAPSLCSMARKTFWILRGDAIVLFRDRDARYWYPEFTPLRVKELLLRKSL